MALVEPTGGAGRATLIDALNKLRRQYAGMPSTPSDRGVAGTTYETPAVGPPNPYNPGSILAGIAPGLGVTSAAGGSGATPGDPYGYGNTGWGSNGVNLYNPNLARGDMPAPGPGWRLDNFGVPFWRHDYIMTPQGPKIKGEDGYSGDYPLMTPEQLAAYGIQ